jgi:hypothetical protein
MSMVLRSWTPNLILGIEVSAASVACRCGCCAGVSVCQTHELVDQCEVEADVYALTGWILRFCPLCGTSTQWHRSSDHVANPATMRLPTKQALSPITPLDGQKTSTAPAELVEGNRALYTKEYEGVELRSSRTAILVPKANRRRDVRTRVSFTACVRQGASEEIVECDNISRGGVSFRSGKSYAIGSVFEVAVPYSPGSPAIFVPATIRHVKALHVGALFRYGASYGRKASIDMHPSFER